jgi:hypothetical protein
MVVHGYIIGAEGHIGARSDGWLSAANDGSERFAALRQSSVRRRPEWRSAVEELSM